ncbi:hypothetical protein [Anaerosacchariphilus polymeriproducens]|uniref:Uncharacterized protein n=1 Tax=Anaerosacchariphilus polymeriproducens TaxID=1812858 RepID=A0A371AV37_9FIRM|nr:hypothetical protein [Anaerosacchariphilus polymeriproducens]RDU23402.1 hypothetical protein DWV06_10130 [Anaerosacchariphilus polymeriproducens]
MNFITLTSQTANTHKNTKTAWIALAVAIISPIITIIIVNYQQRKMKQIELFSNRGLDIVEEYITITSKELHTTGVSDRYKTAYSKMFLYTPKSLFGLLEELNLLITDETTLPPNLSKCEPLFKEICRSLNYNQL